MAGPETNRAQRGPEDGYPLGRAYKPDPRDAGYLLASVLQETAPAPILSETIHGGVGRALDARATFALRAGGDDRPGHVPATLRTRPWRQGPTLDQQDRPHCVAYAWLAFLLSAPMMSTLSPNAANNLPTVAPQGDSPAVRRWTDPAYRWMQQHDEWPGEAYAGTSVRAGAQYLRHLGHIQAFAWAWDVDTVKAWLRSRVGGPLVVGTDWFSGMWRPDADGYVDVAGAWVGGHAFLVHWYSARTDTFHCRQSWGRGWGLGDDGGTFKIRGGQFQYLLEALNGEACAALQTRLPGEALQDPTRGR